jgi:hypothetical protein
MKDMRIALLILLFSLLSGSLLLAQNAAQKDEVTFEELYDDPYAINKLFVGFQPFYGELFATNVNAGFGLDAHYYHHNKFNIKAQFRKTYSSKFFDFNRQLAIQNGVKTGEPEIFNYYEVGGTYHVRDFDVSSTTRVMLYKKKFSTNRWASTVPLHAEVPAKLRKIYGARAGAIVWNSTTDITRALEKQNLTYADLVDAQNNALPETYVDDQGRTQTLNAYSNIYSANFYLGGSLTLIRNMAVSFDKYDEGLDDGIFTVFMDVIFAPSMKLDPVVYNNVSYSTAPIKLSNLGMRVGLDGKFNREIGWGYGGEIGYRPSIDGRGFFALLKISFPVFGTNLDRKVEAYNK